MEREFLQKAITEFTKHPRIRIAPDAILTKECEAVEYIHEIDVLFNTMLEVMKSNNGMGLAAPQIGIPIKAFVAEKDGQTIALLNPNITWASDDTNVDMEGCLSYPGVRVPVTRPASINVEGFTYGGEPVEYAGLVGSLSRCVQHEVDHLLGICHVDAMSTLPRSERKRIMYELKQLKKRKR